MDTSYRIDCYAARLKDNSELVKSRSGGFFISLCNYVLERKGVVYGCSGLDPHNIIHKRAESIEECEEFRKTKYIQSKIGNTFRQCRKDLVDGKLVLFSGTGCQIKGLISFLQVSGAEMTRLITVDLICHGVPSPGIFYAYMNQLELMSNKRITAYDFRNKQLYGWRAHKEVIVYDDGSSDTRDEWTTLFYSNLILRPACYECLFTTVHRESDFTIGDYWGIEKNASEFDDNKGVNIVIIHTNKGKEIFLTLNDIVCKKTNPDNSLQPNLIRPSTTNRKHRTYVMRDLSKKSFKVFRRKYLNKYSFFYIREKIKSRFFHSV